MNVAFIRELHSEQKKARHKKIWLVPLVFLLFEMLWMLWQLSKASLNELANGYFMLFYHLPIMNTILLPIMIAVIASRLCDMEIKGDTLKLLYTMQKSSRFFDCKFLCGLKYLFFFTIGHGIMILLCDRMYHFKASLDIPMFVAYLAVTFCVSAVLFVIQQMLSLISNSQIMPLVIGLAGSFLGLFSLFFPAPIARLIIWGYFAAFPCVQMNWERATRMIEYYKVPFSLYEFLTFLAVGIFIYILCKRIVVRKEV
ncbi:MAG: ABC transporter permease [Lachnospiraceae bacterium]|nr:ABC transporter permease [Lachnospiraceae bacterium]